MTLRHFAALFAALVVLGGCGSATPTRPAGSTELLPAAAKPSPGTHRVVCTVTSDHGRVRLALDLPRGFVAGQPEPDVEGPRCSWHRPVKVPDASSFDDDPTTPDTFDSDVVVTVSRAGKRNSVQSVYDAEKAAAVKGNSPEGDDSILHLSLTKNVLVFGDTVGDRVSYLCYCDGQNLIYRYAEADGTLLGWSADLPLQKETDRQLEAVLASAGSTG